MLTSITIDITGIIIWGIIFLTTLIIEIETLNLTTIWFSLGSLISLIIGIFGANYYWQIGVFLTSSLVLIAVTKPFIKKISKKEPERTNLDRLVGQSAIVTTTITLDEPGEVKIQSNYWRAVPKNGETFLVGDKVIINEITGVRLVVSKFIENKED